MSGKEKNKTIRKIIIISLSLLAVFHILTLAPNFLRDDIKDKTKVIINNSDVTRSLDKDVYIEEDVVYIAKSDIYNFFDEYIYYDDKYNQIITGSYDRIASLVVGEKEVTINGSTTKIYGSVNKKEDIYYIPFSELDKVYNVKTTYIEETNTVLIDSLDRKCTIANSSKNNGVRYKATTISRIVDKVKQGEGLVVVNVKNETLPNGWVKVRTERGILGYLKQSDIANIKDIRQDIVRETKMEGKVSLVWDYFSEYVYAPDRSGTKIKGVNVVSPTFFVLERLGKGKVLENVDTPGKEYIDWAHSNGYQVWPSISNNSMIDTTSEIINDAKLREKLIDKIVDLIVIYELDGINIDFENMYMKDKDMFSRFIIELAPRLNEMGKVLSVDVTAPDGSETWSLCYNRNLIGKVSDYIVFMAYDQNGISSPTEGTTAGHNWVEANINKFLGQEEVEASKLVLGVPFYTRLWENDGREISSIAINLSSVNNIIPSDAKKTWDDDLKQYYVEYTSGGIKYKMWVEDAKSIKAKMELVTKYNLAGAAYWAKDRETLEIWDIISEELGI